MKLTLAIALIAAVGASWRFLPCGSPAEPADGSIRGQYVEARTASVFAGPCHYNGELTTQGRSALLAWSIEEGRAGGIDLAGSSMVAAVTSEENLGQGAARRSVLYLPASLGEDERVALRNLAQRSFREALGTVESVVALPLEVRIDGERYSVKAGDAIALEGVAMPDRACCTMPSNVWYEPLVDLQDRVVGNTRSFRYQADDLGVRWTRSDENDAFVGRFEVKNQADCCAVPQS